MSTVAVKTQFTSELVTKVAHAAVAKYGLGELYDMRVAFECAEIDKQGAWSIWLNWINSRKKFESNPNKLVLPWLLKMLAVKTGDKQYRPLTEDEWWAADPIANRDLEKDGPVLTTSHYRDVTELMQDQERRGLDPKLPVDLRLDSDKPDIDLDCIPEARDELKTFAASEYQGELSDVEREFGYVCSVGTWTTYKLRSALVDVHKAHGHTEKQGKKEILDLTTNLPDDVDDMQEGGQSTCKGRVMNAAGVEVECKVRHALERCPVCRSDSTEYPTIGKLLASYENLRNFYEVHPDIVDFAVGLVGRIRSMGKHAGAIIIADRPLYGNLPLNASRAKNDENAPASWISMWTEGRNTQLSKFGYIKWDILGLKNLRYIFDCCKLIKESTNGKIDFGDQIEGWECADPENNVAGYYWKLNSKGEKRKVIVTLNDPKALKLAAESKTDGVFQFDTPLAKQILGNGVKNFEDLMLFNAMGHPGPMDSIPDAVANRDGDNPGWEKELARVHPELLKILEDTYGVICYHEDTRISMADGRELPIKLVRAGDLVHSVNQETKEVGVKPVQACVPTFRTDGLCITLSNGYKLTVTHTHNVLSWDGMRKAEDLSVGDLVATPLRLPVDGVEPNLGGWIGSDHSVAYLLGQLAGDGMCSSTSSTVVVGDREELADRFIEWVGANTTLACHKFFHCRSWYVGLSHPELCERITDPLPEFVDDAEWWINAYRTHSGDRIAEIIGRSTWLVYDRLRRHCGITKTVKHSRKNKWQSFLRAHGMKVSLYHKRVPEAIMTAVPSVRHAFLAGLIDTDGTISVDGICHITSESPDLIDGMRKLFLMDGIAHHVTHNRVYVWDTVGLSKLVSPHLLYKSFDGKPLRDGAGAGVVPRSAAKVAVLQSFGSYRACQRATGLSRQSLANYDSPYVRTGTATTLGINLGDLRYHKVASIEPVYDVQFYDLSVADWHTLIANGIVASNCYQEQLAAIWQRIGGFTSPEAQDARKAVAKKWKHLLLPIEGKWMEGASKTMGSEQAAIWWHKQLSFARYAFNRSHAVSYCLTAYKCLWLKAHFPAEWWAAVMTHCHPQKLIRYVGVAKSEREVVFGPLNISRLTHQYTVTPPYLRPDAKPDYNGRVLPVINQGLIGIKGIGEKASRSFETRSDEPAEYKSIDEFVNAKPRSKTVLERLIKLGSFQHLHPNRKATFTWYMYKYGSDQIKDVKSLRREVDSALAARGHRQWTEAAIKAERQRQISVYRSLYPKRTVVPKKILFWQPKIEYTREDVMGLVKQDFTNTEILDFERKYVGYYLSNPMNRYVYDGEHSIANLRENGVGWVHAVVTKVDESQTKKGDDMCRMYVNDGQDEMLLLLWSDECEAYKDEIKAAKEALLAKVPEVGVGVYCRYSPQRHSCTLYRPGRNQPSRIKTLTLLRAAGAK